LVLFLFLPYYRNRIVIRIYGGPYRLQQYMYSRVRRASSRVCQ